MIINGLQKLTLLDFPGHTACTVFLAGCDMKCPFCHNSELIDASAPALMTDDELMVFLKKRTGLLDGVAFTGGEPLLRKELPELFEKIKDMGYAVKLDTNGAHPKALAEVLDRKLVDYVAMDVKNSPEHYPQTCGRESVKLDDIKLSIRLIMDSGIKYEFRTTVVEQLHDESSFEGIGQLINGAESYFIQPFTDRETVVFSGFSAPDAQKLEKYLSIMKKYVKNAEIRGY